MNRRMLAWTLVAAQFALLVALVLVPRGTLWVVGLPAVVVAALLGLAAIGLGFVAAAGLGRALTASPIPRDTGGLVTTGVYARVRHPIYTGLMLGGAALLAVGASVWHLVLFAALVLLLMAKARWEERMLLARYPDYAAYAGRVGRFLPGIGRLRSGQ